ncbi:CYFA0S04e04225g1_1 [Cyberlindnera fabianii]|uniref:CYFA0S04e04225g1_1 n=1 Tax=Cyberlindnera fabianii TaxID=36022 RepID=A0A061ARF3_CYBFA|nr:CYFA0S04e04225g1_1 [Cyberlindnera fabianii]
MKFSSIFAACALATSVFASPIAVAKPEDVAVAKPENISIVEPQVITLPKDVSVRSLRTVSKSLNFSPLTTIANLFGLHEVVVFVTDVTKVIKIVEDLAASAASGDVAAVHADLIQIVEGFFKGILSALHISDLGNTNYVTQANDGLSALLDTTKHYLDDYLNTSSQVDPSVTLIVKSLELLFNSIIASLQAILHSKLVVAVVSVLLNVVPSIITVISFSLKVARKFTIGF